MLDCCNIVGIAKEPETELNESIYDSVEGINNKKNHHYFLKVDDRASQHKASMVTFNMTQAENLTRKSSKRGSVVNE